MFKYNTTSRHYYNERFKNASLKQYSLYPCVWINIDYETKCSRNNNSFSAELCLKLQEDFDICLFLVKYLLTQIWRKYQMKLAHSSTKKYGALKFHIWIIFNPGLDSNQFLKKILTRVYQNHFNACFF